MPYGDINEKDDSNNTLLYHAINIIHVDIVRFLLDNGADINIKNINGHTCLDRAIYKSNLYCFESNYEKAIKILELILQELPSIDTIKNTNINLYDTYRNNDIIELCIKYYSIIDSSYVHNNILLSTSYKDKCIEEINQLTQHIYDKTNLLDLVYKYKNKNMVMNNLARYAKNPYFTTHYEVYTEVNDFVKIILEKRDRIDKIIEEISIDNNLVSMLPYDIKYLIISQTI
ncbi:ankyrin [Raccoonpox virus]|nr:ankyrin [Raccoonpox virus]